jgi:hypothetical protein
MGELMNTSREAFYRAHEEGLIGRCQMKVVHYLLEYGTATQREVQLYYNNNVSRTYGTRFKELERAGVIECIGTKLDETTNHNVKFYRLSSVPTKRVGSEPTPVRLILDRDLACAVIEADDACYGCGNNPSTTWKEFVKMAVRVAGVESNC